MTAPAVPRSVVGPARRDGAALGSKVAVAAARRAGLAVRRWAPAGAALLSLLAAHAALAPHLRLSGVAPDLPLVAVVAVAAGRGARAGAAFGFAAGLGADVFLATPLGTSALAFTVVGHFVGEVMGRRATGAGAAVCTPASPCFACRIRRSGAVRHPERSRPQGTRPERRRTERRRAAVRRAAVLTAAGVGGGRLALVLASTALGGVPFPGGGGLLRVAGVAIVSAPLGPPAFAAARRRPAAAHPNGGRRRLAAHPGAGRRRPAAADPGARRPAAAHPGTDRAGRRAPGAAA